MTTPPLAETDRAARMWEAALKQLSRLKNAFTDNLGRLKENRRTIFLIAPACFVVISIVSVATHPAPARVAASMLFAEVLKEGAPIALVSIGAALVISTGGVDLSSMGVATFAGVVFAIGIQREWLPIIAVSVPIITGGIIGHVLGKIVARDIPPLITSWAVGSLCTIVSLLIAKNAVRLGLRGTTSRLSFTVEGTWMDQWDRHGHGATVWLLILFGVLLLLAITSLPQRCCAIGANRTSALYAGVRLGRSIRTAYTCSGALSAVAGMFYAIVNSSATTTDLVGKELQMIAVAVIGGTVLTGGYFNPISVVASAFFWTLIWSRSQTFDITDVAGSNQQHVANAMFATVILALALTLGRRLSGFTAPVIIETTAKEIEP